VLLWTWQAQQGGHRRVRAMELAAFAGSARTAADREASVERQRVRAIAAEKRARERAEQSLPQLIRADDGGCVRVANERIDAAGMAVVMACLLDPRPEMGFGERLRKPLCSLTLDSCGLLHLPDDIAQLRDLRTLNVSYNLLEQLPAAICDLPSLTTLYVNNNRLVELPPEIGKLSATLEFVYADFNRIDEMPASIERLYKLRTLWVQGNPIRRLPKGLRALKHLESVRMSEPELKPEPEED
jgi:Leucine-rich repeat (LRR) protein